jgi:hypothetical protein
VKGLSLEIAEKLIARQPLEAQAIIRPAAGPAEFFA